MTPYLNLGRDSNIVAYENGPDYIKVKFGSGTWSTYIYTFSSEGINAVEKMKSLAIAGQGLNAFISKNKPKYSSKF